MAIMIAPAQLPAQPTVNEVEMSNVTSQQAKAQPMSPTIQAVESGLSQQEQEEEIARLRGGGCCGALCTCICAPFIAIGACLGAILCCGAC